MLAEKSIDNKLWSIDIRLTYLMIFIHGSFFVTGLLSWDSGEHQVDLEKELATLTAQAPEGEEARYGKS